MGNYRLWESSLILITIAASSALAWVVDTRLLLLFHFLVALMLIDIIDYRAIALDYKVLCFVDSLHFPTAKTPTARFACSLGQLGCYSGDCFAGCCRVYQ